MVKHIDIIIENKMIVEKRDMNIYHNSTKSAHIISPESSVSIPLKSLSDGDYLHISLLSGPGKLRNDCVIDMPSWIDFDLSYAGDAKITHASGRTLLKIPPGPPIWQIKMTQSFTPKFSKPADRITISERHEETQI